MLKNKNETMEVSSEQLLNGILEDAAAKRVSDIHIEPLMDAMRVRFRIDGYLKEHMTRPLHELEQILTRIKAISNLDIATHLPQDGHFEFTVTLNNETQEQAKADAPIGTCLLNIRVSVYPTVYGETAVLRLLNRSEMLRSLDAIGMEEENLLALRGLIKRNYGMVLMTGPAGSGKTTTLYSILQELNKKDKNIVTLEDPVEFYFGDIRQTQIKPDQGFTFAVGMKAILRQDPDIIMIGEIRDSETAEYAMQASLVGRLVVSTVHSNTAIGTIARLIDMGIERSLIAYAVNGIIAQRLVRVVCESCKTAYVPDAIMLAYLGLEVSGHQYVKGAGCKECGGSGYRGRTGVYNVLVFDDQLRALIVEKASIIDLQAYIDSKGAIMLKQRVNDKILAGVTTVEEAAGII